QPRRRAARARQRPRAGRGAGPPRGPRCSPALHRGADGGAHARGLPGRGRPRRAGGSGAHRARLASSRKGTDAKRESAQEYAQRLLSYTEGGEPLRLQQAAPRKVAALLKGKNRKQLSRRPAPDKWSATEIVAHLADAEIAISWRLRQILSRNAVPIQAYDEASWAATFDYRHRDPKESLARFKALREGNLALLKSVPRRLWSNYGLHEERGKESVAHMVRMVAGHDLNHLRQLAAILATKR